MPVVMPLLVQQRLFWQWVPERLLLCRSMRYYAEKREPLWQNHTATEKGLLNMSKNFARLGLAASTAALTGAVCSVTAFAESGSGKSASGSGFGTVGYLIFMVLLFAVMYFILIRPQKKKDKEAKAMQSSLQVGDEIVTIGGIVGLVVQVNEEMATTKDKVYAGGDAVTGAATVILAMGAGKTAAASIDEVLRSKA